MAGGSRASHAKPLGPGLPSQRGTGAGGTPGALAAEEISPSSAWEGAGGGEEDVGWWVHPLTAPRVRGPQRPIVQLGQRGTPLGRGWVVVAAAGRLGGFWLRLAGPRA